MQTWMQVLELKILLSFNFSSTKQDSKTALWRPQVSCEIQDKLVPPSRI